MQPVGCARKLGALRGARAAGLSIERSQPSLTRGKPCGASCAVELRGRAARSSCAAELCAADLCCPADRLAVKLTDTLSDNLLADRGGQPPRGQPRGQPRAQPRTRTFAGSLGSAIDSPRTSAAGLRARERALQRGERAVVDVCNCACRLSAALSLHHENNQMRLGRCHRLVADSERQVLPRLLMV